MSGGVAGKLLPDLDGVAGAFAMPGRFQGGQPHGSGHINDTFQVTFSQPGGAARYVLQRINEHVFRNVPALMENVQRVTAHASRRSAEHGGADAARRSLQLVPARDGQVCHRDAAGGWWRCYHFIEGASSHDLIETPAQAREAARAFGEFQRLLSDLPGARLHETIPNFHHTRQRFEALRRAIVADSRGRAAQVPEEIAFAHSREGMVDRLLALQAQGDIPERVTHNDTKLNNVMIDDLTGVGICVIDLDTVMPGLAPYDFGEMVRSATNAAAEDERDLALVYARRPMFEALVEGYLATARAFLNPVEIGQLAFAGRLMTYENGLRFLTDFLQGDTYFKIARPEHNLDRARNQFALLRSLEAQQAEFEAMVRKHAGG